MPKQKRWRPTFLLIAISASSIAAFVLVGFPSAPDRELSTRQRGGDAFLNAVILMHNVNSLLTNPGSFYQPPYLFPDKNPMRGTEPLISESLLALPIRLILGDRPILVFTILRIVSLIMLSLFTVLLLREIGVMPVFAIIGGILTLLASTTVISIDKLQAIHLQWIPLVAFYAIKIWRGEGWPHYIGFASCLFLAINSSFYTDILFLTAVIFLIPLFATVFHSRDLAKKTVIIILLSLVSITLSAISVSPWLMDRSDMGIYSTPDYMEIKRWGNSQLEQILSAPEEFANTLLPAIRDPSHFGYFPGYFVIYLGIVILILYFFTKPNLKHHYNSAEGIVSNRQMYLFKLTKIINLVSGLVLIGFIISFVMGWGQGWMAGLLTDSMIWVLLISWSLRLALWPNPWSSANSAISITTSAAYFLTLVLFILSLGSPIEFSVDSEVMGSGILKTLAGFITPLNQLREVRRFLVPMGWTLAIALALSLHRHLRNRSTATVTILTTAFFIILGVERFGAKLGTQDCHPITAGYELLKNSSGKRGLLELPMPIWNSAHSIRRMFWQPRHNRPIVNGYTGIMPPWRAFARSVFNTFPSTESLLLIRAWDIDTVLTEDPLKWDTKILQKLPQGVAFRGRLEKWKLFDILPAKTPTILHVAPPVDDIIWITPQLDPDSSTTAAQLRAVSDNNTDINSAATIKSPNSFGFSIPAGSVLRAIEINYGYGATFRIPKWIRIFGKDRGRWHKIDAFNSNRYIHARVADQLMNQEKAKIIIILAKSRASTFRLESERPRWQIPEIRLAIN